MQELLSKVTSRAPCDTSVLLLGESGVGKEHIARQFHDMLHLKEKYEISMVRTGREALAGSKAQSFLFAFKTVGHVP